MKTILLFAILTIISFACGWTITGAILLVFSIILLLVYFGEKHEKKEDTKRQTEKAKKEKAKAVKINNYEDERTKLIAKYGTPTHSLVIEKYNLKREIIIFEKTQRIWLCGNDLPLSAILNCTFSDNPETIKGYSSSNSTNNSDEIYGRALVGSVLFGAVGAVLGAASANKNNTHEYSIPDRVIHSYVVIITVNNLATPTVRIPIGDNGKIVNEIVSLMQIIITRNKK